MAPTLSYLANSIPNPGPQIRGIDGNSDKPEPQLLVVDQITGRYLGEPRLQLNFLNPNPEETALQPPPLPRKN
jgi:hypothetical protein